MKKITLLVFSLFILLGLFGCSNHVNGNNKKDVREVVWRQLSAQQKERINGTWKDGKVSKITLNKHMMSQIKDKSYEGKKVYLIDFPTKSKSIPNNMVVYADMKTFNYIGIGLVD